MAVEAVLEQLDSRTGNVDWRYHRTYLRRFKVYCGLDTDDCKTAANAVGIPAMLSSYPTDVTCRVKTIDVRCDGAYISQVTGQGRIWTVDCNYDSLFEFDVASVAENPLLRPALWKFSWEAAERYLPYDIDGVALKNTAGTPINPPLAQKYAIGIITIQVNKSTWTVGNYADVQEKVNSDTWLGQEPGTVLVRGVTAEQRWENNYLYWAVTWTLALSKLVPFRPTKVLSQGFFYKEDDVLKVARDFAGAPLPHPVMLDEDGMKTDTPYWQEFNMREEMAFTGVIP